MACIREVLCSILDHAEAFLGFSQLLHASAERVRFKDYRYHMCVAEDSNLLLYYAGSIGLVVTDISKALQSLKNSTLCNILEELLSLPLELYFNNDEVS